MTTRRIPTGLVVGCKSRYLIPGSSQKLTQHTIVWSLAWLSTVCCIQKPELVSRVWMRQTANCYIAVWQSPPCIVLRGRPYILPRFTVEQRKSRFFGVLAENDKIIHELLSPFLFLYATFYCIRFSAFSSSSLHRHDDYLFTVVFRFPYTRLLKTDTVLKSVHNLNHSRGNINY